jgi:hypothetical protein
LVKKAERLIGRKISYVVFRAEPIPYDAAHAKKLLLWTK